MCVCVRVCVGVNWCVSQHEWVVIQRRRLEVLVNIDLFEDHTHTHTLIPCRSTRTQTDTRIPHVRRLEVPRLYPTPGQLMTHDDDDSPLPPPPLPLLGIVLLLLHVAPLGKKGGVGTPICKIPMLRLANTKDPVLAQACHTLLVLHTISSSGRCRPAAPIVQCRRAAVSDRLGKTCMLMYVYAMYVIRVFCLWCVSLALFVGSIFF